jgi:hypothetical protein
MFVFLRGQNGSFVKEESLKVMLGSSFLVAANFSVN